MKNIKNIKNINILFVDDSIGIRLAAEKIFQNLGFHNLALADDGIVAMERLKEKPFDLVFADWNMGEMSGLELFKEMKKNESLKEIPFILVTGDTKEEKHRQAKATGIENIMTKPFDVRIIREKIIKIFNLKLKQ
jgi:two-component system, chemotaxis family, chemotaxis protein CheY